MALPEDVYLPDLNAEWVEVLKSVAVTASDTAWRRMRFLPYIEPNAMRTVARLELNHLLGLQLPQLGFYHQFDAGQVQWIADSQIHKQRFRLLLTTGRKLSPVKALDRFQVAEKGPATKRAIDGNIPFMRMFQLELYPLPHPTEADLPTYHVVLELAKTGMMKLHLAFVSPPYYGGRIFRCEYVDCLHHVYLDERFEEKATSQRQFDVDVREKDGSGG